MRMATPGSFPTLTTSFGHRYRYGPRKKSSDRWANSGLVRDACREPFAMVVAVWDCPLLADEPDVGDEQGVRRRPPCVRT
jgi:hypothetical protein